MLRTTMTALAALVIAAPLALAEEYKSDPDDAANAPSAEELEQRGAERIAEELEKAKEYQAAAESDTNDEGMVEKLATEETAEVLLKKNVNNSQAEEVAEEMAETDEASEGDKEMEPASARTTEEKEETEESN